MPAGDSRKRLRDSDLQSVGVQDVAKMAGCSTATVSRALNSPGKVSPALAKRVRTAVEKLGYTPNNAARALRSRSTRILGTVIPTLDHSIYARQVNALQRRLADFGYSLMVTTSEYDVEEEFKQVKILVQRGAEGVVLVGDAHHPRLYEFLVKSGIPYVNTYVFNPASHHPCVGFDNRKAARQLTEFVLQLGHTELGVLAGITADNDRAQERLEGLRAVLAERNLELPAGRVVEARYSVEAGYQGMRSLLSHQTRPTAVVCFSDILAFGAMAKCVDEGLRIPEDVSIVGFDNLEYATHVRPALTTIEVPASDMGRRSAEYLMGRLESASQSDYWELETKLIVRSTSMPPPSRR